MQLDSIKEIVLNILKDYNDLSLYDLKWTKEFGENILQILIDKEDGIDLDTLALINEKISLELDNIEISLPNYLLEVSSPGAEKELRNLEEIKQAINKFIYLETSDLKLEGYLLEVNDDSLVVKVNLKGRMKNFNIKLADIKFIRLAVKF